MVNKTFKVGQKVACNYYHEYLNEECSYKRKWWQLFDAPFKPVKMGVIVGNAGVHPYWLSRNNQEEQYLLVKFKEYFFAKPIPISCLKDCKEFANDINLLLSESRHRVGEKGYSLESFTSLTNQANKADVF